MLTEKEMAEVIKSAFYEVYSYDGFDNKLVDKSKSMAYFEKYKLSKWVEFAKEKGWDKDKIALYGEMLKIFNLYFKYLHYKAYKGNDVNLDAFDPNFYEIFLEADRLGLEVAFKYITRDGRWLPFPLMVEDAISKVKQGWQPFEIALFYCSYWVGEDRMLSDWIVLGSYEQATKVFEAGDEVENDFLYEVKSKIAEEYGAEIDYEELKELYKNFILALANGEVEIEGVYVKKDQENGDFVCYVEYKDFWNDLGEKLKETFIRRVLDETWILLLSDDDEYGDKVDDLLKEIREELMRDYGINVSLERIKEIYRNVISNKADELEEVEYKEEEGYYVQYKNWNKVREWLKEEIISEALRQKMQELKEKIQSRESEVPEISPPSPSR